MAGAGVNLFFQTLLDIVKAFVGVYNVFDKQYASVRYVGWVENTMTERIKVIQGDITRQAVDAIVNAANPSLLGGGGVDGAIHAAAGPELLAECRVLNGCATGEAKITRGYRLNAPRVIHTVGPIWYGGGHDEDALLARCYQNCFLLAVRHGITTIAFPAISTGAYHFPMERAVQIAVTETRRFLESQPALRKVVFVCFNGATFNCYCKILAGRPQGKAS